MFGGSKRPRDTSWFRGLLMGSEPVSDKVITIYSKDIRHYSDAVQQAKATVERKRQELVESQEALATACQEFIAYCGEEGLQLPIQMELDNFPTKKYVLEE